MSTAPYFNSGYLQAEIDWANYCRELERKELEKNNEVLAASRRLPRLHNSGTNPC